MIRYSLRKIGMFIKRQMKSLPVRMIWFFAGYLLVVIGFIQSLFLFNYYMSYYDGTDNIVSGNYTAAVEFFENNNSTLNFESWKKDFNVGVASYISDSQESAINSFESARSKIVKIGDDSILCAIDVNIAYSYEKIVSTSLFGIGNTKYESTASGKTKKANDLQALLPLIMNSVLDREKTNKSCMFMGAKFVKTNTAESESDKELYNKIVNQIYKLDKKQNTTFSEQNKSVILGNSSLNQTTSEFSNKKLQELFELQIKAQREHNKTQEALKSKQSSKNSDSSTTNSKVVEPY